MKYLYNILGALLTTILFFSCESDIEKVVFDSTNSKPVVVSSLAEEYELDIKKAEETALVLEWKNPEIVTSTGQSVSISNTVQIDLAQKDFSKSISLGVYDGNTNSMSITHSKLNSQILSLLNSYELDLATVDVEFRIVTSLSDASKQLLSNVISTKITPYSGDIEYPEVFVIGTYSSLGWDNAQSLFCFKFDSMYEGIIDFSDQASSGFKLTGDKNWDNGNYGLSGGTTPEPEATEIVLFNDGGSSDIKCYTKRFYHFSFNKESLALKMNYGFNVLSIVGNAGDEVYEWADPNKNGKEVDMSFDPVKQVFYADVNLGDGEIKFRADHDWGINFGVKDGMLVQGGDNITVSAGKYRIYVNLNNSTSSTFELNSDDYKK